MINYGLMLRNTRISRNMRQEDLARKIGVSQKSISAWEVGRSTPDIGTYLKLSDALGVTAAELIGLKCDLSTLTAHDVIMKLHDFNYDELKEISCQIQRVMIEKERVSTLEKQVSEYRTEISRLKRVYK